MDDDPAPQAGDDTEDPAYILTQLRVGHRMPKGETPNGQPQVNTDT